MSRLKIARLITWFCGENKIIIVIMLKQLNKIKNSEFYIYTKAKNWNCKFYFLKKILEVDLNSMLYYKKYQVCK